MSEALLKILNIHKVVYAGGHPTAVIENFSLDIKFGEFISILGPSGSGKSTLLRIIAGLEEPTSGEIFFDGQLMNQVPAHKRNFVMIFQQPALFSHLNIFENISYGLKIRKICRNEIEERANSWLQRVDLLNFGEKMPDQLSGGEQQRVALARALIVEPRVLLLDEPLAHLDPLLRKSLRKKIREIQRDIKITMLMVTHDEDEAVEISDRVVRLDQGLRPTAMKLA